MGLGTAALLVGIVLMIAGLVRWPTERLANVSTLVALGLSLLGGLVGVWMVLPTPEQKLLLNAGIRLAWVGSSHSAPASGSQALFFGWDLRSGDWRIPHFIGLHALQALPALAWLHLRQGGSPHKLPAWIGAGIASYVLAFVAAVGITATGKSVLSIATTASTPLLAAKTSC